MKKRSRDTVKGQFQRRLTLLLALVALSGCGGDDASEAGASDAGDAASQVSEPSPTDPPPEQARSDGTLDYADVCAALNPDALAGLLGASVTNVESRDRSMMDSRVGDCRIFVSANEYVEVGLWDRADDRFIVNKGGGETSPLADEARARRIEVAAAERAVVLWANEDFESEFNNIRAVVLDLGGRALGVTHGGLGPYRTPETLLAVAERARLDLGW